MAGDNVIFDLSAVGTKGETWTVEWTPREVILYALGVGAGQTDPSNELQFTTENSDGVELQVLPAFAVVQAMCFSHRPPAGQIPLAKVLHGEQSFVVHAPIQPSGSAALEATLVGIYDHGKAAHVVTDIVVTDAGTGAPLLTTTATIVVRGEGGWGGERRVTPTWIRPEGEPDIVVSAPVRPDQALLYRLSGDRNPLHSDPVFAQRAGFDRPILHGMCTFGIAGRLLVNEFCHGDATSVRSMGGRFSKPVMPGETLTLRAWADASSIRFVVENPEGVVVLDRGEFSCR
jgi:acyl dehydratase